MQYINSKEFVKVVMFFIDPCYSYLARPDKLRYQLMLAIQMRYSIHSLHKIVRDRNNCFQLIIITS